MSEDVTNQPATTMATKANQTRCGRSGTDISTGTIFKIIRLNDERGTNKDEARGIMSVIGTSSDIYTSVGKFLAEHEAALEESFGGTLDDNSIGCSFFIFKTKKTTITRMIQEIEMNQIDEISSNPGAPQLTKTYEMRITAKNRTWILRDIMEILEPYARIITPRCKTAEPFRLESGAEIEITHIYLKFEISIEQTKRLGEIMDRIRGIGQNGFWNVEDPREINPRTAIRDMIGRLNG